ncbi:hypothetical protein FB45DRAFT_215377 [Roridomyces roridus]|uniref:Protein kinase domain-containing protein n=1 Tax=Roridomyces roridus TaxID=1738132 RepID=A0AAD7BDC3_9AGAR|nr:hypothetical protein FB45DRAFT_215377 [Roridomyces roridus]
MNDDLNASSNNYHAETLAEISDSGSAGFAGAFFPQSRHLRVTGGTFMSHVHVHQDAQGQPEEFKRIGRWEIDLQREIVPRTTARRVFSAKIRSEDLPQAVILFEGAEAEAESREYISRHANFWHPNLLQIFGVSNFSGKHAVNAQDDLLPYTEYLDFHPVSTIRRVYLHALWASEISRKRTSTTSWVTEQKKLTKPGGYVNPVVEFAWTLDAMTESVNPVTSFTSLILVRTGTTSIPLLPRTQGVLRPCQ